MKITILTIFSEVFDLFLKIPLVERALRTGIADIRIVDMKPFAGGSFRHIDEMICPKKYKQRKELF